MQMMQMHTQCHVKLFNIYKQNAIIYNYFWKQTIDMYDLDQARLISLCNSFEALQLRLISISVVIFLNITINFKPYHLTCPRFIVRPVQLHLWYTLSCTPTEVACLPVSSLVHQIIVERWNVVLCLEI